jgi:xylulokinase
MSDLQTSYIIAIDLGTSGPKVALVTDSGHVVAKAFEPVPVQLVPEGGAEQDPQQWQVALIKAFRDLLGQNAAPLDRIAGIGVTGQFSGVVPVGKDGRPLMNAIIWLDSRGAPYVQKLTSGLLKISGYGLWKLIRWIQLTGGIPSRSGKDTIAHILWLKYARPEVYRATWKLFEPKDYINYLLTGQAFCTSSSATVYWMTDNRNLRQIRYHPWLLETAGLERDKLPDIRESTDIIGVLTPQMTEALGLPRPLPVIGGAPDVHSAAIGSGGIGDYDGHLYIGTSSWITCHVPFKKSSLLDNMASIPSAIPGRYLVGDEQESAGSCLTYIYNKVLTDAGSVSAGHTPYASLDEMAARAPVGSDGLIFTPWLYGERTPVEDRTLRGGFFNLSLTTDRDRMVRAVLEGVAYNSRWLMAAVERFTGRRFPSLRFIGGGAHSALWCQIFADVLDRPILQVADPGSATLRGVALLASVALGKRTFEQLSSEVEVTATYTPADSARTRYDKLFKVFLDIYRGNRATYAKLNGAVSG